MMTRDIALPFVQAPVPSQAPQVMMRPAVVKACCTSGASVRLGLPRISAAHRRDGKLELSYRDHCFSDHRR